MDVFCVSQPALVGCDDDAQISGEHEEEEEKSVSLKVCSCSQSNCRNDGEKDNGC